LRWFVVTYVYVKIFFFVVVVVCCALHFCCWTFVRMMHKSGILPILALFDPMQCLYRMGFKTKTHLVLALASLSSLATLACGYVGGHGGTSGARCLGDEGLVDVRDHTTTGDGGLDQGVELLVTANGKQQVAGGDTFHLQVLARITGQLKNLSSKVLHDGRGVHGGGGTNTLLGVDTSLQETVDTTDRELQTCTAGSGLGCSL
jgi:hypothetical protein